MAKYSGKAVTVAKPINEIYHKISDLSTIQSRINELPEEAREKVREIRFENDRILANVPGVGEIAFAIVEKVEPSRLRMSAENSPVPFNIVVNLTEKAAMETEISTMLDIEIPAMLRPLVGGKLQQAADKFSEMFTNFFK
jgi:hypothetical protein